MPGDQEINKVHLFPYSGKTSNASLDHYQTKFDRHCVECGVIVPNQAIEKSKTCPRNHPVDLRGGDKGHDRFMLSAWGRCQYCDNFISAHHKFCPCCGRINDNHDANKNRRLHRALVKSERHTVRAEINKLLGPLHLYLGLNSQSEYYIVSEDDAKEKNANMLALEKSPKKTSPSNMNPPEINPAVVAIPEATNRTSTPLNNGPDLSLCGSSVPSSSVPQDEFMDSDDAFLSMVNVEEVVVRTSWTYDDDLLDEPFARPLTQSEPFHGSSKSGRPSVKAVNESDSLTESVSQGSSSSLDRSGRSASQCSRQLRPRTSSKKNPEYTVPVVEPAKKKTRKSSEKKMKVTRRIYVTMTTVLWI